MSVGEGSELHCHVTDPITLTAGWRCRVRCDCGLFEEIHQPTRAEVLEWAEYRRDQHLFEAHASGVRPKFPGPGRPVSLPDTDQLVGLGVFAAILGVVAWRFYTKWSSHGPGSAVLMLGGLVVAGVLVAVAVGLASAKRGWLPWVVGLAGLGLALNSLFGAFGSPGSAKPGERQQNPNAAMCAQLLQMVNTGQFGAAAQLEGLETGQDPTYIATAAVAWYHQHC